MGMMTAMSGAEAGASTAAARIASKPEIASVPHTNLPLESAGGCVRATSASASMIRSTRYSHAARLHPHRHRPIGGMTTRIATMDMGVTTLTTTTMSDSLEANIAAKRIVSKPQIASALHSNQPLGDVGGYVGAALASASTIISSKFTIVKNQC